jgi:hypothetical protein
MDRGGDFSLEIVFARGIGNIGKQFLMGVLVFSGLLLALNGFDILELLSIDTFI